MWVCVLEAVPGKVKFGSQLFFVWICTCLEDSSFRIPCLSSLRGNFLRNASPPPLRPGTQAPSAPLVVGAL